MLMLMLSNVNLPEIVEQDIVESEVGCILNNYLFIYLNK
jgi:hypothetical protein